MEYNLPSELIKRLDFGQHAKDKVIAGVTKLAQAVKSTILMKTFNSTGGLILIDLFL